ncbi:LysR family transcriptional regulator [Companilactobacillus bobalius]|nr:LysR family transcriptional regulator [Companilactobacillus bobalius]KAE9558861.1 hypothetical protein ATN92_13170 [Companilactobacillus bobalius]OVE97207.1 HTH-type transcriptional regulator XapR [Companilactobacillus bobalius]GEO58747.1 LysR family transcriptional regulator [Companilactobacillus paralimentarius]
MELRVLRYFIEIVNDKSITSAAEKLHISQSTLSRQIKDLEEELGTVLFERGPREISLTNDGYFFLERAKEIDQLVDSTSLTIQNNKVLSGDLYVAAGEGKANAYLTRTFTRLIDKGENVNVHFDTQDADQIFRNLDAGVLDFGVVYTNDSLDKYNKLSLPIENKTGVVMPRKDDNSGKDYFAASDLKGMRLLIPRQMDVHSQWVSYLDEYVRDYKITGTYDMNYNMRAMVMSGMGNAITFDKPEYETGDLVFKDLNYIDTVKTVLIWKKSRSLSRLADEFLKNIMSMKKES